jgi:hypothetical protein
MLQNCRAVAGHGEPIRMFIDLSRNAIVSLFVNKGAANFLIAASKGQGFVVKGGRLRRQHPQGQAGAQRRHANEACAIATVAAIPSPLIGTNHKMVLFPLEQVPEMARGRGVRLQKYSAASCPTSPCSTPRRALLEGFRRPRAGMTMKELSDWRGNRADAGRLRARPAEVEQVLARRGVGLWHVSRTPCSVLTLLRSRDHTGWTPAQQCIQGRKMRPAALHRGTVRFDCASLLADAPSKVREAALRANHMSAGRPIALLAASTALHAQTIPGALLSPQKALAAGEWPAYGGTYAAARYSPLTQITKHNAKTWRLHGAGNRRTWRSRRRGPMSAQPRQ